MTADGPRPIHLIGVGGAGMSGLARLAAAAGYRVTGTDRDDSPLLARLREAGVDARAGHSADALPGDAAAVVVSTAIAADNPELVLARSRGLPEMHRSHLLAELMAGRRGLAVAGAHGKSTTSAMLSLALGDASACVGAEIDGGGGTGAVWGTGPWFVAEADESDRSLLRLSPEAAILTNVEHDHHATYASLAEVEEVFRRFLGGLPGEGLAVIGPDRLARACAATTPATVRLVGPAPGAWCWPEVDGGEAFLVLSDGRRVPMRLQVPGRHNLANAACAVALAEWCGVGVEEAVARLGAFRGVGRRFELRGEARGVTVVDDYAHHPTEVAATLDAARERHRGRVVAVFQPHLYSRTKALGRELGEALGAADLVVVTEIYAAREPHDPEVSGRMVADAVPAPAQALFAPTLADAADLLVPRLASGDLVLTLGAGDVTGLGQELLGRLQRTTVDGERDHGRPDAA